MKVLPSVLLSRVPLRVKRRRAQSTVGPKLTPASAAVPAGNRIKFWWYAPQPLQLSSPSNARTARQDSDNQQERAIDLLFACSYKKLELSLQHRSRPDNSMLRAAVTRNPPSRPWYPVLWAQKNTGSRLSRSTSLSRKPRGMWWVESSLTLMIIHKP